MGSTFAQFSQGFDSFVVPPGQTVNSGVFGNVLLTQGAIAALGIVPLGVLDIQAGATVRVGQGGYEIPFLQLQQTSVPTQYDLLLTDFAQAKPAAVSPSSPSAATTSPSETPSSAASTVSAAESSAAQVLTSGGTPKPTSESTISTFKTILASAPAAASVSSSSVVAPLADDSKSTKVKFKHKYMYRFLIR